MYAAAAAIPLVAAGVFLLLQPSAPPLPTVEITARPSTGPAMCPWRRPEEDLAAFFPGAEGYRTEVLVLSRIRQEVLRRLGPGARLEENSLYVYFAERASRTVGAILVRRTAGPHGAIEVVVGVRPDGRVAGVRVQRHREPPSVVALFANPSWLAAFRGKTADSALEPGAGLPAVPDETLPAARAVASAVRSLLIEYDVGRRLGGRLHLEHD